MTFEIYPAIDLLGGQSVRLKKGLRSSAEVVHPDPTAQLEGYASAGARWVHIVDLAAAFGDSNDSPDLLKNEQLLKSLLMSTRLKLQVGGGIRSARQARRLFELGVQRVVIGTWAVQEPDAVVALSKECPGKVVLGLDTLKGFVSVQGWTEQSRFTAQEMGKKFCSQGLSLGLFTEVERDGLLTGIDWAKAELLSKETGLQILASGGVRDIDDIISLSKCGGVVGVVVGKALAAGTLKLEEALKHQR